MTIADISPEKVARIAEVELHRIEELAAYANENRPRNRNVKVVALPVGDVLDHEDNFRMHPDEQQRGLDGAVQEIGWFGMPDLFVTPTGDYKLVDGHLRKSYVIGKYGPDTLIDFNLTDFTEGEAVAALATKDPLTEMATRSKEKLQAVFDKIDLSKRNARMRELLERVASKGKIELDGVTSHSPQSGAGAVSDEERRRMAQELVERWGCEPGTAYRLRCHGRQGAVVCGDATEKRSWLTAMQVAVYNPAQTAVVTSPPYNLGDSINLRPTTRTETYNAHDDTQSTGRYQKLIDDSLARMLEHAAVSFVNVQWLAGCKRELAAWIGKFAANLVDTMVWQKHAAPAQAANVLSSSYENIYIFSPRENATRAIPLAAFRGTESSFFQGASHTNDALHGAALHGAAFPAYVPNRLIKIAAEARTIIDPFLGTGTTMIEALKAERDAIGIELDPVYVSLALDNLSKEFGGDLQVERIRGAVSME